MQIKRRFLEHIVLQRKLAKSKEYFILALQLVKQDFELK
jgi:hypothetical protein